MTSTTVPTEVSPLLRTISPQFFRTAPEEVALFERELQEFVPANAFDAHAHLYDLAHLTQQDQDSDARVDGETYFVQQQSWMKDRAPSGGLFFAFPSPADLDMRAANEFLHRDLQNHPDSRGLLMIRPDDDAEKVEAQIESENWSGFKPYHIFAARPDTQNAFIGEFLPEWAWQIAHRRELCIMLHMVRARSLADADNQEYIRHHCRKYPGAKLILAHAGRGFCAAHTVEGIASIAGLPNVYFDTSAICEAPAIEAILETFGPTRLMFGSDFPISQARGRAVSLGDGFHWIYDWEQDEWPNGEPILIGLESLLAVRRACQTQNLNDADIELIFGGNARRLLKIEDKSTAPCGQTLYEEAKTLMPGGTQLLSKRPEMYAPGVWPPYFREARGIEIITLGGQRVLDFTTCGIGSCLLGYAHPAVKEAVLRRARLGAMSTLNPPEEVELARRLLALHPWAQNARFARAGGEALAMATRLARAATGRDIIAFCGYHGWHDWYLAANLDSDDALSGHLLPGLFPSGVPRALRGTTIPFFYNDLDGLEKIVRENGDNLAAVVMEPARGTPPAPGFLEGVRALCDGSGARLVFDEVTSGFRFHHGGLHMKYNIAPDLTVFAKALGNGHPIAAVIGRSETMSAAQTSFISSTYWTESVGPTAALATLDVLAKEDAPNYVELIGNAVRQGLDEIARECSVPLKIGSFPALTVLSFDHDNAVELMTLFTTRMLARGFLAGSGFYPTLAHTRENVEEYLAAARLVLQEIGEAVAQGDVCARLQHPVKHSGFRRLN